MTDSRHQDLLKTILENLKGVSFKGQQLKLDSQENAAVVVSAITSCNGLEYLELEGNTLGVDAALGIGKALEGANDFKYALWKDLFTGRLKTEIPKALKYLFAGVDLAGARLVRLDLSDNAIGPMAMPGLKPFFESPSSYSLKELILNNNGMGPEGGTSLSDCLLECLESSERAGGEIFSLRVLICGRNRLENKAATNFSKFIRKVKTLEEIQMMQNGIYAAGLKAVAEALAFNPNMKVINLNDNTMKNEAITALANSISQLHNLEELSISDCLLKNEGSLKLVNALKSHRKIERIILESNEIKSAAGIQIAEIVRTIPSLKMINIGSNEFGETAVHQITQMLRDKEVEIEDDQGESGGEEENENDDDDDENQDNTDESYNNDSQNQSYGFSTEEEPSVLNNSTTSMISSTIQLGGGGGFFFGYKESSAQEFWKTPTVDTLKNLQPDPFNSIKNYARELSKTPAEETSYSEFCIQGAFKILEFPFTDNSRELFENILIEAYDSSASTGAFSTHMLIYLGLMKSEDKKFLAKPVPQKLNAVTEFVRDHTIPGIVCESMLEILRHQMTQLQIKPPSYLDLESELQRKVEALKL